MDPDIVQAQVAVSESFAEYEQLKSLKHPLKSNFVLTLALFNLLTIFGAIWVAFFISKQITGPIQRLAEGTRSVAKGDYDFALEPVRDDEVGFLVNSFNQMLRDLRASRDEPGGRRDRPRYRKAGDNGQQRGRSDVAGRPYQLLAWDPADGAAQSRGLSTDRPPFSVASAVDEPASPCGG
jgi:HAMP domain-containing protein